MYSLAGACANLERLCASTVPVTCVFVMLMQDMKSPLHYAARSGHKQTVEMLIRFGANVNALDVVSWYVCDKMS